MLVIKVYVATNLGFDRTTGDTDPVVLWTTARDVIDERYERNYIGFVNSTTVYTDLVDVVSAIKLIRGIRPRILVTYSIHSSVYKEA